MSGDNFEKDDPLSLQGVAPSAEFRSALFARTSVVLVRRRRHRRALVFAALAASYLAGLATMFAAQSAAGGANGHAAQIVGSDAVETVIEPVAETRVDDPPAVVVRVRREIIAHSESLRRLGDTYLLDRNDPEGAVRCYRLALKSAKKEDSLFPTDEGTWLFRALKQDQNVAPTLETQEIHDAKDNG